MAAVVTPTRLSGRRLPRRLLLRIRAAWYRFRARCAHVDLAHQSDLLEHAQHLCAVLPRQIRLTASVIDTWTAQAASLELESRED